MARAATAQGCDMPLTDALFVPSEKIMNASTTPTPAVPGVLDDPMLNRGWRSAQRNGSPLV